LGNFNFTRIDPFSLLAKTLQTLKPLVGNDPEKSPQMAMVGMYEFIIKYRHQVSQCFENPQDLDDSFLKEFNQKLMALVEQEKEFADHDLLSEEVSEALVTCRALIERFMQPTSEIKIAQCFQKLVGSKLIIDDYSYSRYIADDGSLVAISKAQCIEEDQKNEPAVLRVFCDDNLGEINLVIEECGDNVLAIHFREPTDLQPAETQQLMHESRALLNAQIPAVVSSEPSPASLQNSF